MSASFGVTLVLRGEAVVRLGRRRFVVRAGDCVRFDGVPAGAWSIEKGPGFAECAAYVDGLTGARLRELGLWDGRWARLHVGAVAPVVSAYVELHTLVGDPGVPPGRVLRRFLDLADLLRGLGGALAPGERFRAEAVRLLAADLSPAAGLGPVARRLGLSPAHFRRRFREVLGESPVAFRIRLRLERAAELLGSRSVKEVAAELGYPDPFALSRQFRARFGVPPSHLCGRR
jgi:AraC-like DNA-binding protein